MTAAPEDILSAQLDDRPHEECGVVGVSGIDSAAELAFLGLYALQHPWARGSRDRSAL